MKRNRTDYLTATYMIALAVACSVAVQGMTTDNYLRLLYSLLGVAALAFPRVLSWAMRTRMTVATECLAVAVIVGSCIVGEALDVYDLVPMWDDLMHLVSGFLFCAFGMSVWQLHDGSRRALAGFAYATTAAVMWEEIEYFCDRVLLTDMQKDTLLTQVSSHLLSQSDRVGHISEVTHSLIGDISLVGVLDIGLYDTMNDLTMATVGALVLLILYRMDQTRGTRLTHPFILQQFQIK